MPKKGKGNAQMNQLVQQLRALVVARPPKAKSKGKRKRRRARGGGIMPSPSIVGEEGAVRLSRCEILSTVVLPKSAALAVGHVDLVPDNFAFLKSLFRSFDRIRWESMVFYYKPAVGTVWGGLITFGMDWDFASSDVRREQLSAFSPSMTCAAWADSESKPMVLAPSRLMSRAWYLPSGKGDMVDKGPGKMHWALTGTVSQNDVTVGELWCRYTCVLQGTNPA